MIDLLLPSWLAGILLVMISGPLGSFVIWRKMAYFGDTLAHASLLGLAFGFLLQINLFFSVIFVTLLIAIGLVLLEKQQFAIDTLLGIFAHSALSLGLIVISLIQGLRIDLMGYLFGDLLSINYQDLLIVLPCVIVVLCYLFLQWRSLLFITVSPELAFVNGINIQRTRFLFTIMVALTIGIGMKFVGALIISSLLIIPAATARRFAKTPEQMAIFAMLFGVLSTTFGLLFSFYFDTPSGPSVVFCSTLFFIFSLFRKMRD